MGKIGMKMKMDKSFEDKVKNKLELNKVNDVVKQIEKPQPTELQINIPTNPFMVGGEDEYESDELTYQQNEMFKDFLKRNKYKNFGEWWKEEGEERMSEHISEVRMTMSEKDYRNETEWWDNYIKDNIETIKDRLVFSKMNG